MDGVGSSQMQEEKKYIHLSFEKSWVGGRKKAGETFWVRKVHSTYRGFLKSEKFLKQQGNAEGDRFHKGRLKEGSGEYIKQHQG